MRSSGRSPSPSSPRPVTAFGGTSAGGSSHSVPGCGAGVRAGRVTAGAASDTLDRAFHLEGFRGYLALEAGHSGNTVASSLRDVRRLASYGAARGAAGPDALTATQLREFVYALKDLGLSPATIHRQISAGRTYFKFLVEEGLAARDPSERLAPPN